MKKTTSEEKEFLHKISTIHDPKNYRFIINALINNNDTEYIENKRKQYYESEIKNYVLSTDFIEIYNRIIGSFLFK